MKGCRRAKQFIRGPHRLCYELFDVLAVRTNEFELTRVSLSICLEARIRLTPGEFSFGENLCFRHWREIVRTDALFPRAQVSRERSAKCGGGRSRGYGKVADFTWLSIQPRARN